ncbi:MAG: tetratricopeptide repeat protein [Myxococcales bacterium]|nr:tetratricopeptide repeat protein [Myxococcales bacterium]
MITTVEITALEKSLKRTPEDVPLLEQLVRIHEQRREWPQVVNRMLDLATYHPDPSYQMQVLRNAAEVTYSLLQDPVAAMAMYSQVVKRDPTNTELTLKLLGMQIETGHFEAATRLLEELTERDDDPRRASKYLYTLGVIRRDHIGDDEAALTAFNHALDKLPARVKAFDAIVAILGKRGDWRRLVESYQTMISRYLSAAASVSLIAEHYETLGDLYETKLQDRAAAVDAFELAMRFDPERVHLLDRVQQNQERLGVGIEQIASAIRRKIHAQPDNIALYVELFEFFHSRGDMQRAFAVANVLVAFNQATHPMIALYKKHRGQRLRAPERPLSADDWAALQPDGWDHQLGRFFELAMPLVQQTYVEPPSGQREKVEIGQCEVLRDALQIVSRLLQIAVETVYTHRTLESVSLTLRDPSAITVGAPFCNAESQLAETTWEIARALSYLRPRLFITLAIPEDVRRDLVLAAAYPERDCPVSLLPGYHYDEFCRAFEGALTSGSIDANEWSELRPHLLQADLDAWQIRAEMLASRVGLLACGDVTLALNGLRRRRVPFSSASPLQLMRDVVTFSIGENYMQLRLQLLGLA